MPKYNGFFMNLIIYIKALRQQKLLKILFVQNN